MCFPIARAAALPNIRSAAPLNSVTRSLSSKMTIASIAVETISRNRASDWSISRMWRSSITRRSLSRSNDSCSPRRFCLRYKSTNTATFARSTSGWNGFEM